MTPKIYTDLVDVLQHSVAQHGPRNLFGTKQDGHWEWTTYAEVGRRVDEFRGGLARLGIEQGETVAIISNNRVEWAIAAYATYGRGARFCPMYETQLPKDWRYILQDSEAKVLIVSSYAIYEEVRGWVDEIDTLDHVFCMALPSEDDAGFGAVEALGREQPSPPVELDPEWICGFIYTSGTTGKPKGVLLSHSNITSNINAVSELFPIDHSDISVSFLPWAHSFGQTCELHCMISRGAAMAVAESVEKLVDNFQEVRPTLMYAVPRIFNRIYDGVHKKVAAGGGLSKTLFDAALANAGERKRLQADGKSSWLVDSKHSVLDKIVLSKIRARFGGRLRFALSGGAALSSEVADFIDSLGILVCEGYGLTETSPIATANHPGARRIGSVGQPIAGVEIIIDKSVIDDEDSDDGEVIVKGPNVMKGYHNRPQDTAEVMTENGGFRTGDLGRLDAEGFLYITGRIKEQYKLENGKYVVPGPLEEALQLSGLIAQAFIHGFNKPFNVALIVPDRDALEGWARESGVRGGWPEILQDAKVRDHMQRQIDAHSGEFKGYERVRDFRLLAEEFSVDNGMLTPKLSVKRRVVMDHYGTELEEMHAED
ncbi:MAG: long-chain fatty acid--CoA ligase [Acidobacteriota bacterium]